MRSGCGRGYCRVVVRQTSHTRSKIYMHRRMSVPLQLESWRYEPFRNRHHQLARRWPLLSIGIADLVIYSRPHIHSRIWGAYRRTWYPSVVERCCIRFSPGGSSKFAIADKGRLGRVHRRVMTAGLSLVLDAANIHWLFVGCEMLVRSGVISCATYTYQPI